MRLLFLLLLVSVGAVCAQPPPPPPPPAEAVAPLPPPPPAEAAAPDAHAHEDHSDPPAAGVAEGEPVAAAHATPTEVFRLGFMRNALLVGLIVGGVCAYLGLYVVLRRIVFVGAALAELSSAGVALALLVGLQPTLGAVGLMLLGVGLLTVPWSPRRVRQDAFIGVGYVMASALVILLLANHPQGDEHLHHLLFGNVLLVTAEDVKRTALALGGVLLVHALFAKELLFVSFDPDTAAASGYRARLWEALLYITIGLAIAFAIRAVGVLLTFALLIIPAVTALLVTRRMRTAFVAAVALGLLPIPVGLYLSFLRDLPSAATIVAVSFVLLLLGGIASRLRG